MTGKQNNVLHITICESRLSRNIFPLVKILLFIVPQYVFQRPVWLPIMPKLNGVSEDSYNYV